jgi:hypothetical protein
MSARYFTGRRFSLIDMFATGLTSIAIYDGNYWFASGTALVFAVVSVFATPTT